VFEEANCTLEGQIADLADRIAYNGHDLEDGMKARLLDAGQMQDIAVFTEARQRIGADKLEDRTIQRTRTAKAIIDALVSDCIDTSGTNIAAAGIQAARDACARPENLIGLSAECDRKLNVLETFLLERFYHHAALLEAAEKVRRWLAELFERLCTQPERMPGYFQRFIPEQGLQRTVCDYIAGMTDRFACKMVNDI
jgi:dGTPase